MVLAVTHAQYAYDDRTGYDGDFFSLEGTIEVFKASRSLSDFERRINSQDAYVNNLDLDGDGRIDYIRVEHRRQGDYHLIILQDPVSRYDVQDVAVIEIERTGSRSALLQIIGDEDLYGPEMIVEPFEGSRSAGNGEYISDNYVNVYYWPVVQQIFGRDYVVYASPYRWHYYPTWWVSWRPFTWNIYINRVRPYHRYCHVVNYYRAPRVHHFYTPYRRYSNDVHVRNQRVREYQGRNHPNYNQPTGRDNPARLRSDTREADPRREVNRNQERPRQEAPNRSQLDRPGTEVQPRQRTSAPNRSASPSERTNQPNYRSQPSERTTPKVNQPRNSGTEVNRNTNRTTAPRSSEYRNNPPVRKETGRTGSNVQSPRKSSTQPAQKTMKPINKPSSSNVRKSTGTKPGSSTRSGSSNRAKSGNKTTPARKSNNKQDN
ncbi:MAG: hypothetical protein KDC28_11845 [Saprospiraceae bacterium]|nr:hypothetical protein [Saprospiraceae bacterium]